MLPRTGGHGKSKCAQLTCEEFLRLLNQMKMLTWIIQAPVVLWLFSKFLISRCRCFHMCTVYRLAFHTCFEGTAEEFDFGAPAAACNVGPALRDLVGLVECLA